MLFSLNNRYCLNKTIFKQIMFCINICCFNETFSQINRNTNFDEIFFFLGINCTHTHTHINFQLFKIFQKDFYRFLSSYISDICSRLYSKRINWKDTHILQSSWISRIFIPSLFFWRQYRACAPAISRECLYSTIFRLRFIARLLSSRLSNCSLDFSQPLVFIALSSRTLSQGCFSFRTNLTTWCACVRVWL